VHGGVQWLSTLNVYLAAALALAIFILGPTVYILNLVPAAIGGFLQDFIPMSTRTGAFVDPDWLGRWTVFYWAWWLSWAPFVGAFIARISHGRTIREFIFGVLLVPSGVSVIWFAISGGSALWMQQSGTADFSAAVKQGEEVAMFTLLGNLPLTTITTGVTVILIALYFVSGADAASLVLGSLTTRGSLHPPRPLVVMWGTLVGAVSVVLLLAGGLEALQQATILVALPFVGVMLLLCMALLKELRQDPGAGPLPIIGTRYGLPVAIRRIVGDDTSGGQVYASRLGRLIKSPPKSLPKDRKSQVGQKGQEGRQAQQGQEGQEGQQAQEDQEGQEGQKG